MKWVVLTLIAAIAVAVGAWWYEGYRASSALLAQPVYRVLREHERALYDELVAEYRVYERDEQRAEEFTNLANEQISLAATRALARASQPSVLALVGDMVGTAKKLQPSPGDACFRFWFPKVSGPPDIARLIDTRSQAHTLELMGEVIRSASEEPQPLPEPEAVKDNLASVINATYAEYGSDAQMIAHADDPRVDRAKVCAVTISVYDRILRLPPAEAAALLRAMTQVH